MFEIHEISAAPHFPEPLKDAAAAARPENVIALLAVAAKNDNIEIIMREGEIFIELSAD
jgi:hypothetical protein